MTPAILGVDPGKSGGMVVLRDGRCVGQIRIKDIAADGWRPGVAMLVADHVREWQDTWGLRVAYVERPQHRPGEGGAGALTTGIGWGLLVGALVVCGLRVELVTPAAWRRQLRLPSGSADPKADAVSWAAQVPHLTLIYPRCRVPDEGIADAACIAGAGAVYESNKGAP